MNAIRFIYRHREIIGQNAVFLLCLVVACGADRIADAILSLL